MYFFVLRHHIPELFDHLTLAFEIIDKKNKPLFVAIYSTLHRAFGRITINYSFCFRDIPNVFLLIFIYLDKNTPNIIRYNNKNRQHFYIYVNSLDLFLTL